MSRPDISPRKSCVPSLMSAHGLRLTRATMRHVRSGTIGDGRAVMFLSVWIKRIKEIYSQKRRSSHE